MYTSHVPIDYSLVSFWLKIISITMPQTHVNPVSLKYVIICPDHHHCWSLPRCSPYHRCSPLRCCFSPSALLVSIFLLLCPFLLLYFLTWLISWLHLIVYSLTSRPSYVLRKTSLPWSTIMTGLCLP